MARTLSDDGVAFIAQEEGVRNEWYQDALSVWTIGIGHVWNPATDADFADRALTDDEVWDLFRIDVAPYVDAVNRLVTVPLTQRQFDRLVSFAFNWGIGTVGGFPASSVLQFINAGDFLGVARDLVEGHGPTGRPYDKGLEGVRNRRIREAEPFRLAGGSMRFVSRAEWGARSPASRSSAPGMSRGVGVHWLGPGSSRSDHARCASQMREVQAFHMGVERGWSDFAYNAAACRHGYVFEGRGERIRNAANGGGTRNGVDANAGWASVLYLEGTDGPGLTPEGQDAINDAADWLGVADGEWLGHRDFLGTECPGDRLYDWVHSGHPRGNAPAEPEPEPTPPEEDELASPYTLFNWGGAVWAWSGGDPLPLDNWGQVEPYLNQGALTIGDLSDEQFRSIAPTFTGRHPAADKDQHRALAAVRGEAVTDDGS